MKIIIDMDGTLCDTRHRDHLIKESWDAFHAELHNDKVYDDVVVFINAMSSGVNEIILLTGRMEKFRGATENWLIKSALYHQLDELVMRGDNDYRKSFEMKCEYIAPIKDEILMMLDDNDNVVEHARNLGVRVWQVGKDGL